MTSASSHPRACASPPGAAADEPLRPSIASALAILQIDQPPASRGQPSLQAAVSSELEAIEAALGKGYSIEQVWKALAGAAIPTCTCGTFRNAVGRARQRRRDARATEANQSKEPPAHASGAEANPVADPPARHVIPDKRDLDIARRSQNRYDDLFPRSFTERTRQRIGARKQGTDPDP